MKLIISLVFLLFSVVGKGQTAINKLDSSLVLIESEYDFGKIPQGKAVNHVFMVKNVGKTALTLDNVQASCGCTTPEWVKGPIEPGQMVKIAVGYNAAIEGAFNKSISITYNSNLYKQINIKGEVWQTPINSAPLNTGLERLKSQR